VHSWPALELIYRKVNPVHDYALSAQQLAVICALSSGATTTGAAHASDIHRNTINNWRRNSLPFQRALADAQYDKALLYREKLEELFDQAILALQAILLDPKASASVRLKAALSITQMAIKPPEPKKQVELLIENVHNPAQPPPEPRPEPEDGEPAPYPPAPAPAIVHNSAQVPYRREHPKVGRNEACPCGSGLKYKRCCLNKCSAAPAVAT
jgi:hypothetical protein